MYDNIILGNNHISHLPYLLLTYLYKEEVMLALTFLVNLLSCFMSIAIILPREEAREERGKVDRYWQSTSRLAIGTCRQPNLLPM